MVLTLFFCVLIFWKQIKRIGTPNTYLLWEEFIKRLLNGKKTCFFTKKKTNKKLFLKIKNVFFQSLLETLLAAGERGGFGSNQLLSKPRGAWTASNGIVGISKFTSKSLSLSLRGRGHWVFCTGSCAPGPPFLKTNRSRGLIVSKLHETWGNFFQLI